MVQWGFACNYPEFVSRIMMSLFFLSLSFPPQQPQTILSPRAGSGYSSDSLSPTSSSVQMLWLL